MTNAEKEELGVEFFRRIEDGNYAAAAAVVTQLHRSGESAWAGRLLEALHGMTNKVSVKQTVTTVEAGSTIIGYQGSRF